MKEQTTKWMSQSGRLERVFSGDEERGGNEIVSEVSNGQGKTEDGTTKLIPVETRLQLSHALCLKAGASRCLH